MNKWIYKMEYKYGRFCIPNLMLTIIIGQGLVYFANLFVPAARLSYNLSLLWPAVLQGQVWRLLTFIFVPDGVSSPLLLLITLYFYYFIGHSLENHWGDFKFNVYYLFGMIGAIVAAALTGYGSAYYLNLSLFFAFAMLYPDLQVLLFFIIPVKVKWMAWLSAAMCAFGFLTGGWAARASIVFSLVNFFLFFGNDFFTSTRDWLKYSRQRRAWRNQNNFRR